MSGPLATGNTIQAAPPAAQYVVLALDPVLTNERMLTAGAGITLVDGGAGGAATLSVTNLYLRLDCSNDPLTAGLEINAATAAEPVLILQTTDDNVANSILEIQASGGAVLSGIDGRGIIFSDGNSVSTNFFAGNGAGNIAATGGNNIAIGTNTLQIVAVGLSNIAIGTSAGLVLTSGESNVLLGVSAGRSLTTGIGNFALGTDALRNATTAGGNVAIGTQALVSLTTGIQNIGIGAHALYSNLTGQRNIAISTLAGRQVTGSENTFIGWSAGRYHQAGDYNVFIGGWAGRGTGVHSNANNTAIGFQAGTNFSTADNNVLIGYRAGDVLTTGDGNIIIGSDADPTGAAVSSELNIGALIYGDLANNMGGVNVTPPSLAAAWHVDQATSDAAIPVLLLDQADVDQEMIEFVTTIGVGNAIEAVGIKTLTVTHFIKISLPGPLTRYIPCGTIA